jgi:pantoate--beta-alanine ligase
MMTTLTDPLAWRSLRRDQQRRGTSLGLVPTMGALHEGHASLIRRSRAECDCTMVSIFVNPTQFDRTDDFDHYPRMLANDLALLEREGVDFLFQPEPGQLYPDAFRYAVVEKDRSALLEGAHRHGHFDGVLTIVLKLLNIADADRAYFGEKDWQQLQLVQGMVDALFVRTTVVSVPTVREPSGLACSSRNARLAGADLVRAPILAQVLLSAASAELARARLVAAGFDVDYVEDCDGRRLAAVWLGDVRLIDNVALEDVHAARTGRR